MLEGDDFHSSAAREKMASGKPLQDSDRADWVDALVEALSSEKANQIILSCSALTHYVQRRFRNQVDRHPIFILLDAPRDVLEERIRQRTDHFMPVSLLDSQLEALRAPDDAIVIDACDNLKVIVDRICESLDDYV